MKKVLVVIFCLFPLLLLAQNNICATGFNNGFETPVITPGTYAYIDAHNVPDWTTTASNNIIEIWSSGFLGVPAYEGNQFAELNATEVSTLIKNFVVQAGVPLNIKFAHRGRDGIDKMQVNIGPVGGPYTNLGVFADDNIAWHAYQIPYVPTKSGPYELRFVSVSSAGGASSGNFLDGVDPGSPAILSIIDPPPVMVCSNVTLNGSLSSNGPNVTYLWTTANGVISGSATGKTVSVAAPGTYTLTVSDVVRGCVAASAVAVIANPTLADAGPDQIKCTALPANAKLAANNPANNGVWAVITGGANITNATNPNTAVTNLSAGDNIFEWTIPSGPCASSDRVTIHINTPTKPSFNPLINICVGGTAPVLPTTSLNGIIGTWAPAVVSNTATGTYTFTPTAGQCATTATLKQTVTPNIKPAFAALPDICSNTTAPLLPITSLNGIIGTWAPAVVSNTATGTYTFTPTAGQCATTANITQTVIPLVTPQFNALPDICSGGTAPVLPTTSLNGITGTWAPAVVSNTATGTYTFTPTAGLCATTATVTQTVIPLVTPQFTALPDICSGSVAPTLPTTSLNGITGTWTPTVVSNTATGTYTFTPTAGLCATTATVTQTVIPLVTPQFTALPDICSGSVAPTLPTTSLNGITGTWTPAVVSNTATGTYTFTPTAGLCATTATLTQTVTPLVTPQFDALPDICSGGTAPVLPTTSLNGITGTWTPAVVSNTATGTYTFTPTAGLCATTATVTQTVIPLVTPQFTALPDICSGSVAPTLPTTSLNGITGTWTPTVVSNTATGTYTFTPTAGLCATTATLTQTVIPLVTPLFDALPDICSGSVAPTLPTTSLNGITGTWTPAVVSNTATGTYTFTPTAGLCATTATLTQTVIPLVTPQFDALPDICSGGVAPTLPTTSLNGITGTWTPTVVSNTATGTYTFTPTAGLCATTATITQTVIPLVTPQFTALPDICSGSVAPTLPTTSLNGITGTWTPTVVSNTATGTYTFTPTAGLCATTATLTQTVIPLVTPLFDALPDICSGSVAPTLPTTSLNGITGTWVPAVVSNTATGTYTFTPTAGLCATTANITQTVIPLVTPQFDALPDICSGSTAPVLPTTSLNGITGTWTPTVVSNNATGTYTFTPTAGLCAITVTLTQTVIPLVTPQFDALPDICSASVAPTLPTTSLNGITGIWTPAIVSNTATGTYTFTPTAGQCATTATITQTVSPNITPVFATLPTICSGSMAPTLPRTSLNGITGTWTPAIVSNTATGTYTFTPTAGLCATTATITQTISPNITPVFGTLPTICSGSMAPTLPTTSLNGITGTWAPAVVSNTATATYTFTPTAGQCATTANITQRVNALPKINAGNDTTVFAVVPFRLNASGASSYIWTNGALYLDNVYNPRATAVITGNQKFTVTTKDLNGCFAADDVMVKVFTGGSYFIPNTFTPNGDGLNDVFRAVPAGIATTDYFRIFNRWGETIFSTKDLNTGWDGTYKGKPQPSDIYIWIIKGKSTTGRDIEMKGTIHLLR